MNTKLTKLGLDSKITNGNPGSLEIVADKLEVGGVNLLEEVLQLKNLATAQISKIESLEAEVSKLEKDVEKLSKKQPKEKDSVKE